MARLDGADVGGGGAGSTESAGAPSDVDASTRGESPPEPGATEGGPTGGTDPAHACDPPPDGASAGQRWTKSLTKA